MNDPDPRVIVTFTETPAGAVWRADHAPAAVPTAAPEPPGLLRQAASLATAVVTHVAGGMRKVSAETLAARLGVCQGCPRYEGTRCRLCGCNMPVKAAWLEQQCPEGRWPA